MDQTGYDAVWLAEHHFNTYSVCPSTTLMGMHVAARTKRLRIGTAVTLAAFYHPLRLAEELALLDVLSGGRLNWGAGRGFDATEFRAFGVHAGGERRAHARGVEIVLAAWRDERVNHRGKHWQLRRRRGAAEAAAAAAPAGLGGRVVARVAIGARGRARASRS